MKQKKNSLPGRLKDHPDFINNFFFFYKINIYNLR